MLAKNPAIISNVPLHPYSKSKRVESGEKTTVPKPVPLAARPKAIVLRFSNQKAIDTTAVTKQSPRPRPPMTPNVTYMTPIDLE